MPRLLYAPDARRDLYDIWEHLALSHPARARRLAEELQERIGLIAAFPSMGRERPELAPHLRSFPVNPFVIFYRLLSDGDGIEVARVLRQERDIGAIDF